MSPTFKEETNAYYYKPNKRYEAKGIENIYREV